MVVEGLHGNRGWVPASPSVRLPNSIREFRAGLADVVDADSPVAVTRHGQTVGYSIPVKQDRADDAAALRAAGEKLDALLQLTEADVDAMVEEFKTLRKAKR